MISFAKHNFFKLDFILVVLTKQTLYKNFNIMYKTVRLRMSASRSVAALVLPIPREKKERICFLRSVFIPPVTRFTASITEIIVVMVELES